MRNQWKTYKLIWLCFNVSLQKVWQDDLFHLSSLNNFVSLSTYMLRALVILEFVLTICFESVSKIFPSPPLDLDKSNGQHTYLKSYGFEGLICLFRKKFLSFFIEIFIFLSLLFEDFVLFICVHYFLKSFWNGFFLRSFIVSSKDFCFKGILIFWNVFETFQITLWRLFFHRELSNQQDLLCSIPETVDFCT